MTITPYTVSALKVETATTWGTWTEQPAFIPMSASIGSGQVLGDAQIVHHLGLVKQPGGALSYESPVDCLGQFVRISYVLGTQPPLWHGIITGDIIEDQGKSTKGGTQKGVGAQIITATALPQVLSQICIIQGTENRSAGGIVATTSSLLYMPRFNRLAGGDRSVSTVDVSNGGGGPSSAYVHLRSSDLANPAHAWTAYEIIQHILLTCASGEMPPNYDRNGTLRWNIVDDDLCLGFEPPDIDLNGMTVLDAINTLINPRRGITWHMVMDNDGVTAKIVARSIAYSSITVPGGFSLPGASGAIDIDTTDVQVASLSLHRDSSTTYDVIRVTGARPWVGITLHYQESPPDASVVGLVKGWTAAEEAKWTDGSTAPELDHVWRRFRVSNEWIGVQFKHTGTSSYGIRSQYSFDANGNTVLGSFDSAWMAPQPFYTTDPALSPTPAQLELTRELPCDMSLKEYADGDRSPPLVFFYTGTSDATWQSWNSIDAKGYQIQIDNDPASITIGAPGSNNEIKGAVTTAGAKLLVTVGMREPNPMMAQWARPSTEWARDLPRILTVNMPDFEDWLMLPETVIGAGTDPNQTPPITDTGVRTTSATAPMIIKNSSAYLSQSLALLVAYYSTPSVSWSMTKRGIIDTSITPSTMVCNLFTSYGTIVAKSVITRVSWDFSESNWSTSYESARIIPSIESIR